MWQQGWFHVSVVKSASTEERHVRREVLWRSRQETQGESRETTDMKDRYVDKCLNSKYNVILSAYLAGVAPKAHLSAPTKSATLPHSTGR